MRTQGVVMIRGASFGESVSHCRKHCRVACSQHFPSSRQIGDTNQWSQAQLIQNNSRRYGAPEGAASSLVVALHSREGVPTTTAPVTVSVCSSAAVAAATTSSAVAVAAINLLFFLRHCFQAPSRFLDELDASAPPHTISSRPYIVISVQNGRCTLRSKT